MRRAAQYLWLPVLVVVIWQVAASLRWIDPLFFPPPSELAPAAAASIRNGELPRHIAATLRRTFAGFVLGSGLGLLVGVAIGIRVWVGRSLSPLIAALYTTPKLGLLPMVMLFLGVTDVSRIALVALGSFLMQTMHTADAVRGIPTAYVDLARNYGAGGMALLRKVYLPATAPGVFTGLRLALGRALMITVAVELVSAPEGIGHMIWMSWQTFATRQLYLGVAAAAGLGAALHLGLRTAERHLLPWTGRR
ncbi:MAG: ABC transporter permease [Bryobacterales bacterium]|nr:ABC transporter permease [Bryobacterales bacterium]